MKENREIVLAAVENATGAFAFASAKLQANRVIVLVAVGESPYVFSYVTNELRDASSELNADRNFLHQGPSS